MIKKFSSPKMRNRQFVFLVRHSFSDDGAPKIEYKLVADLPAGKAGRSEANLQNLQFPHWCIYTTPLELISRKILDDAAPQAWQNQPLGRGGKKNECPPRPRFSPPFISSLNTIWRRNV